jgi:hypothetical protein
MARQLTLDGREVSHPPPAPRVMCPECRKTITLTDRGELRPAQARQVGRTLPDVGPQVRAITAVGPACTANYASHTTIRREARMSTTDPQTPQTPEQPEQPQQPQPEQPQPAQPNETDEPNPEQEQDGD